MLELVQTGERRKITERFMEALDFKEDKRGLYRAVIDALFDSGKKQSKIRRDGY